MSEVLVRSELHRIHKDAGDEARGTAARRLDQTDVARMQISHGRHKGDAFALRTPALHPLAHRGIGRDRVHRLKAKRSERVFWRRILALLYGGHEVLQRLQV